MSAAFAGLGSPAWAGASAGAAGVEAESGDGHEDVSVADIDGDPSALAAFAIVEISAGWHGSLHEAGFAEDVGDGSGAVVAGVVVSAVATAPFVGFALEAVAGSDGAFDGGGCVAGCVGDAVDEFGGLSVVEIVGDLVFGFDLAGAGAEGEEEGQGEDCEENEGGLSFHGRHSRGFH